MRGVLRKLWSSDTGSRYQRNICLRNTSDSQSGTPLPRLYARADPPHPRQSKAAPPRGAGPANALARLSRSTYIYPPQLLHSQPTNPTSSIPDRHLNPLPPEQFFIRRLLSIGKMAPYACVPKIPVAPGKLQRVYPPLIPPSPRDHSDKPARVRMGVDVFVEYRDHAACCQERKESSD